MKQQISFALDPEDEDSGWTLSISRDGDKVVFGLHWRAKPYPAHSFTASVEDLVRAANTLFPEKFK